MQDRIAAIGGKDTVMILKAAGIEVFYTEDYPDLKELLAKLSRDYAVIYITEDEAMAHDQLLEKYKSRAYPAIIPIPTAMGTKGYGMINVEKDVERAVGIV